MLTRRDFMGAALALPALAALPRALAAVPPVDGPGDMQVKTWSFEVDREVHKTISGGWPGFRNLQRRLPVMAMTFDREAGVYRQGDLPPLRVSPSLEHRGPWGPIGTNLTPMWHYNPGTLVVSFFSLAVSVPHKELPPVDGYRRWAVDGLPTAIVCMKYHVDNTRAWDRFLGVRHDFGWTQHWREGLVYGATFSPPLRFPGVDRPVDA